MSASIPNQKPYRSGQNLLSRLESAADLNLPIEAVQDLARHLHSGMGTPPPYLGALTEIWIAKIVETPEGKTAFTDGNYWVRVQMLLTDSGSDHKPYLNDEVITGNGLTVPALNLAEYVDESHMLDVGEIVLLFGFDGREGTGRRQYVFSSGGGSDGFWALLGTATLITDHQARWSYAFQEIDDTAWYTDGTAVVLAGGRSGTAQNVREAGNPASGYGAMDNGDDITADEFASSIKLKPVRGVVWMRKSKDCDGATVYRFQENNRKAECAA